MACAAPRVVVPTTFVRATSRTPPFSFRSRALLRSGGVPGGIRLCRAPRTLCRAGGGGRPPWADETAGGKVTYDLLFAEDTEFPPAVRENRFVARLLADQGWTRVGPRGRFLLRHRTARRLDYGI